MKKIVRLTESDLVRIVKRVLSEQILPKQGENPEYDKMLGDIKACCFRAGLKNFPVLACGPAILNVVLGQTPSLESITKCSTAVVKEVPNASLDCMKCFTKSGIDMSKIPLPDMSKLPDISKLPLPRF